MLLLSIASLKETDTDDRSPMFTELSDGLNEKTDGGVMSVDEVDAL